MVVWSTSVDKSTHCEVADRRRFATKFIEAKDAKWRFLADLATITQNYFRMYHNSQV